MKPELKNGPMDDNFCPECGTEFLSCCKQFLTQKQAVTEKQAREAYAHIAVGQLKIDGFLIWLEQHGIEVKDEEVK